METHTCMLLQRVLRADGTLGSHAFGTKSTPEATDSVATVESLTWRPSAGRVAEQYEISYEGTPRAVIDLLRKRYTARPRTFGGGGGAAARRSTTKKGPTPADTDAEPFPVYSEREEGGSTILSLPRPAALAMWGVPDGVEDARSDGVPFSTPGLVIIITPTTEPPQGVALSEIADAFAGPIGSCIVVLPCGAGKTAVSIMAAFRRGRRTLVVVPNDDLGAQWGERVASYVPGARVGIIKGDRVEVERCDFVVVTVHSLYQRTYAADVLATFGTVIVDECHHMAAPCFSRALRAIPARCILGLTATPNRPDGLTPVLSWLMGDIAFRCRRAYTDVAVRFVRCQALPGSEERYRSIKGKTAGAVLCTILARNWHRNALIVKEICEAVMGGHKVFVLTKLRDHVTALVALILADMPGVTVGTWMGERCGKSKKARAALAAKRASAAACMVIVGTYAAASEGLDIPAISCVVLAAPVGAGVMLEQGTGRGLRAFPGKKRPLFIDVYDADMHSMLTGFHFAHRRYYKDQEYTILPMGGDPHPGTATAATAHEATTDTPTNPPAVGSKRSRGTTEDNSHGVLPVAKRVTPSGAPV